MAGPGKPPLLGGQHFLSKGALGLPAAGPDNANPTLSAALHRLGAPLCFVLFCFLFLFFVFWGGGRGTVIPQTALCESGRAPLRASHRFLPPASFVQIGAGKGGWGGALAQTLVDLSHAAFIRDWEEHVELRLLVRGAALFAGTRTASARSPSEMGRAGDCCDKGRTGG